MLPRLLSVANSSSVAVCAAMVHRNSCGLGVQRDAEEERIGGGHAGGVVAVIDDFAELATVEPHAAAVRAEIDLHVMTGRENEGGTVDRAVHPVGLLRLIRWSVEGLLRPVDGTGASGPRP